MDHVRRPPRPKTLVTRWVPPSVAVALTLLLIGCAPPPDLRDQRLAEVAQQSVAVQAQQNEHIARQSQTGAEQSRHVAEATQQLVSQDAAARQQLLAAQEKLNTQLQQQRATIDAGRDALEPERRLLAAERQREPILAASIESLGLMLACLLPLALCGLLLWRLGRIDPDDAAVADLLVCELTSEQPRWLPGLGAPPALPHQQAPPRLPDVSSDSADKSDGPPFESPRRSRLARHGCLSVLKLYSNPERASCPTSFRSRLKFATPSRSRPQRVRRPRYRSPRKRRGLERGDAGRFLRRRRWKGPVVTQPKTIAFSRGEGAPRVPGLSGPGRDTAASRAVDASEFDPSTWERPPDANDRCPTCGGSLQLVTLQEKPSWRDVMQSSDCPAWYAVRNFARIQLFDLDRFG